MTHPRYRPRGAWWPEALGPDPGTRSRALKYYRCERDTFTAVDEARVGCSSGASLRRTAKRRQRFANATKNEPNSMGSSAAGNSFGLNVPGIFTSRKCGSCPKRAISSRSVKTRQWSA